MLTRIIGVRQMMLAVMLVRPSCDQIFGWLKTSPAAQGPGAAINALVIAMAIFALAYVPTTVLTPSVLAWAGFLFVALASLLQSADPIGGLRVFLILSTYAAVFTLTYTLTQNRQALARCLSVALCSSFIPSISALLELTMTPAILTGSQRLQSTFTHPNIYAFFIVSVVTLILFILSSTTVTISTFIRRALLVYAGYLVFLLLLTGTRSAWLSMVIVITGYAIVVDRRWLLPVLSLPVALIIPGVSERLSELGLGTIDAGYEHLNSYSWREAIWNQTLVWLAANPPGVTGYGLDSYQSYVPLFFPRGEGQTGVGPHNAFLQIYFEMGIAGLTSFLLLMATIAFKLISRSRDDFAGSFVMFMMLVGYTVVFYGDNLLDYLQFQWFFWFTLGSVCASARFAGYPSSARRGARRHVST